MSKVKLTATETLGIEVTRLDDEWGSLQVTITTEDDEVVIDAGRFHDDACSLKIMFEALAKTVEDDILKDWQDVPDYDCDGWISCDDGDYFVSVEGADWDGDMFPARNQNGQRKITAFPTLEIAQYELAKAMVSSGCFPNCWFQHNNGYTEEIEAEVRKWHDDGGTNMIPLPGVRFEPSDEALVRYVHLDHKTVSWDPVEIVKDYGELGIIYCWPGDGDPHLTESVNVRTQDEHEFEDYRSSLVEFFGYRAGLLNKEK